MRLIAAGIPGGVPALLTFGLSLTGAVPVAAPGIPGSYVVSTTLPAQAPSQVMQP